MTEKRFTLDNFDSVVEMWELLNTQAEIISDLEEENEQLKKELKALIKKYNDFSDAVDKRLKELME